MSELEYRGFTGTMEYCESRNIWHGKVIDDKYTITYESDDSDLLLDEFEKSVKVLWDIYEKKAYEDMENYQKECYKKDQKVLSRVKKMVKCKVFKDIKWEMKQHSLCHDFSIVDVSECIGDKQSYSSFKGCSSPIRTIYDDTGYDSYLDSYGGDMYLSLGKGKYFKMSIAG